MWRRRDVLRMGVASWLMSSGQLGRALARRRSADRAGAMPAPRYFVTMFLSGGVDAIYWTDPKTRKDVASGVDVPYGPDQIVEVGDLRFGPHLLGIKRWLPSMAIVNGVQVRTVAHPTGWLQMARLKTQADPRMPAILDLIGAERDEQPLGCVTICPRGRGAWASYLHSPGWFGATPLDDDDRTLFELLDETGSADLSRLSRLLRVQARSLRSGPRSDRGLQTAENLDAVSKFFDRLPEVPRFQPTTWTKRKDVAPAAHDLQRVLWLLQNDLTRCVFFQWSTWNWDTHAFNDQLQKENNYFFCALFDRFLSELARRRNRHGSLASQTVILVGSEMGRFPYLNRHRGKDHFPEAPYLLMGPGVYNRGGKGAVFGVTGREMQALPVSLRTGRGEGRDRRTMTLDDLGATMLYLAGIDPSVYGYSGRVLEFLVT